MTEEKQEQKQEENKSTEKMPNKTENVSGENTKSKLKNLQMQYFELLKGLIEKNYEEAIKKAFDDSQGYDGAFGTSIHMILNDAFNNLRIKIREELGIESQSSVSKDCHNPADHLDAISPVMSPLGIGSMGVVSVGESKKEEKKKKCDNEDCECDGECEDGECECKKEKKQIQKESEGFKKLKMAKLSLEELCANLISNKR